MLRFIMRVATKKHHEMWFILKGTFVQILKCKKSKMIKRQLCFILVASIFSAHFLPCRTTTTPTEEEDNYGYEYYEEYYLTEESSNDDTTNSSNASKIDVSLTATDIPEDKFNVFCSESRITLTILGKALPDGLKLYTDQEDESSLKNCQKYHQNRTTITYSVDRSCRQLVTTKQIDSHIFHSHEVSLVPKTTTANDSASFSALYTIVMECQSLYSPEQNNTILSKKDFKSERRIFEHRFSGPTSTCREAECPHDSLCLPGNEVDGFYCICDSKTHCNLQCPVGYYGCDRPDSSHHLRCITNGWLCDKRFDCLLKDDETSCQEVWSTWSSWSKCRGRCEGKTQKRTRNCDISFLRDPKRCRLFRGALGCSRACASKQSETENRVCGDKKCLRVKCHRRHMTVEIPRVPSMTSQAIRERMTMGGDPHCKPTYNKTHVVFETPLHKCNTTSTIKGNVVIYSNMINYLIESNPSSIVMRDPNHSYSVTCRFNRRRKVTLRRKQITSSKNNKVAVLSFNHRNASVDKREQKWENMNEGVIEHSASGEGEFAFKMDLYQGGSFLNPYSRSSYPLFKKLHETLYVAIHFQTMDEDLFLMIDKCIATPTANNYASEEEYIFIENGCPSDETVSMYITDISPKQASFSIEAFKFVDPNKPFVYFQCDVVVCDGGDKYCRPNCSEGDEGETSRTKRSSLSGLFPYDDELIRGHVVQGPIIIKTDGNQHQLNKKNGGSLVHRQVFLSEDVSTHSSNATKTSLATTYILVGVVGGVLCLMVGLLSGVLAGRKFKRKPAAV